MQSWQKLWPHLVTWAASIKSKQIGQVNSASADSFNTPEMCRFFIRFIGEDDFSELSLRSCVYLTIDVSLFWDSFPTVDDEEDGGCCLVVSSLAEGATEFDDSGCGGGVEEEVDEYGRMRMEEDEDEGGCWLIPSEEMSEERVETNDCEEVDSLVVAADVVFELWRLLFEESVEDDFWREDDIL